MEQTQKTKKLYQTLKCSLVTMRAADVLTVSVEPTADEIKFDRNWLA